MKQNIIHRNQESYLKPNEINKAIYSYNNSNNINGSPVQLAISNNYYNPDLFINNKSTSIENKIIKLNDLNSLINEKEIQSDKIRNKIRKEQNNELCYNFDNNEFNKNYFFSERKENNKYKKGLDN